MAAPVVTHVTPDYTVAGDTVTIFGTGFDPNATVLFGSTPAINVKVNNPTNITCTVPAGVGVVDITVINP